MQAINIKEHIASAREICPGASEEAYKLADRLSASLNSEVFPAGVVMAITCSLDDIRKEESEKRADTWLRKSAMLEVENTLMRAGLIVQIIDAIADRAFADEVRSECKAVLGWDFVRRPEFDAESEKQLQATYQPCVIKAVDWWTGAIQRSSKADYVPGLPSVYHEFSTEEITAFRSTLAELISNEMCQHRGYCSLHVDYDPNRIISIASEAAGIDRDLGLFILPKKVSMYIEANKISLVSGHPAEEKTIWAAE